MNIKKIITIILVCYSLKLYAVQYACPLPPKNVKIGDNVNEHWIVDKPFDGHQSYLSNLYNKYFSKKYLFNHWSSLGRYREVNSKVYMLECCAGTNMNKKMCIRRIVKASNCDIYNNGKGMLGFKCHR